jgi:hypothetical protein
MGEFLLTLGDGGWFDSAYAGIVVSFVMVLLLVWQFFRRRWAGLLFWSGAALGALLGQVCALLFAADVSAFSLTTGGAIGGVLGILPGGLLADWWQARVDLQTVPAATAERGVLAPEPRQEQAGRQFEVEDYPVYEAEAV